MKPNKIKNYDIFISYRRDGSFEMANLIADRLKNAGYNVFFDVESLKSGKFNEQLYRVIEGCKDFILILPEKGLDRCTNNDDWLRLEIEWALKNGKNIIPVTLRGFEFPQEMPIGMEELKNYQTVTLNSLELFNASIAKLITYLISKKVFTWNSYMKHILWIAVGLAIIASIWGYNYYQNKKVFERVCGQETLLMSGEFVKMNVALQAATDAKENWENYIKDFSRAEPRDTAFIRKQFIDYINYNKKRIPVKNSDYSLAAGSSEILTKNGVKTEEIIVFYSTLIPACYDDINNYLDLLITYSHMPFISETLVKNIKLNYESLVASFKVDYYGYLGFLSTLPKSVYSDEFYKIRRELTFVNSIPVDKTYKECEEQQEIAMKELNDIILEMGNGVNDESLDVDKLKYGLNRMKEDFTKTVLANKIADIDMKRQVVEEKKVELAEKQKQRDEVYNKLLTKCSFTKDEGQWLMWGKIIRLAKVSISSLKLQKEALVQEKKRKDEAIRRGIDTSLVKTSISFNIEEKFSEIYKRIDLFIEYNLDKDPNVKVYGLAAKRCYELIKKGEIDDLGILMIGTENNVSHPILKVGDIVIERKDHPIQYVNDYFKLKDDPKPNSVKIIRFDDNGKKTILTETIPDTKVLVGFLELRETN